MKIFKKILPFALCVSMLPVTFPAADADNTFQREVEYLGRGGYGIVTNDGVYLSWRLLGTEPIEQTFDVYRNDTAIQTDLDATNFVDEGGKEGDIYKVIPHGGSGLENDTFTAQSGDYTDVILDMPEPPEGADYKYIFNDAAIGDVDNDGEYEFIIKWDPTNYHDNSIAGTTGNVIIDCYKMSGRKLWRIDMGTNIRAGSHYTQIIVYDFDGDGKAEMALRTAPGSKDSKGNYVSTKGTSIKIDGTAQPFTMADAATGEVYTDEVDLRDDQGRITKGPDWLTMFNGETGEAIQTVNYYPQRGKASDWGDSYGNRSERYNAGVAYLDGVHPSLVTARGYYLRSAMAAYNWDGSNFTMVWSRDDKGTGKASGNSSNAVKQNMNGTLYGNGDHQISVCDADGDGKDEIVFGSTVVDHDGSILNSTDHGHGDALHASDFNNDGEQEIFQVHEEPFGFTEFGAELRKANNASIIAKVSAKEDVGRGLIGNFDDTINDTSEFFSSANTNLYDFGGSLIGSAPDSVNPSFLIWWDGDLSRELLSRTSVFKYDAASSVKKQVKSFNGVHWGDKDAPAIMADLFGDWREEICYPTDDNETLRIFMTTAPTEYKMPTLMHDTQYRTAVAWQNCGYNQPPHPKFYVGKAALASNNKYLAPQTGFDTVRMTGTAPVITHESEEDLSGQTFKVNVRATGDIDMLLHSYTDIAYKSSLSYAYPRYIEKNGYVYEADMGSSVRYGGSIANVVKNHNINVNYTKKYSGVEYLEDFDDGTDRSAGTRASNCLGRTSGETFISDYTLKPNNKYTVAVGYYNAGNNTAIMAGDKTLHTITSSDKADTSVVVRNWGTLTRMNVTVDTESPIKLVPTEEGKFDSFDTILVINDSMKEEQKQNIDPSNPSGTGLSITGASSVSANQVVLPGTGGDTGTKTHDSYIQFIAPTDGTLSFKFQGSAVKGSNKPRLYYTTGNIKTATKDTTPTFKETTGANAPLDIDIEVKRGETCSMFGYLYNSSNFTFTFTDFVFTPSGWNVTFKDAHGEVLQESDFAVGTMPVYTGTEPDTYGEFTGWSPKVSAVTEDTVYTAQYVNIPESSQQTEYEVYEPFKQDIEKITVAKTSSALSLTAAAKDDGTLPALNVYMATYTDGHALKDIQKLDFNNGQAAAALPQEECSLYVWSGSDGMTPVTDVITISE